ncbi:hypothetical protein SAMN06265348_1217 [Pedobacter westerhofensis]|uniref:Uncharacterized protein n=1 Tax=Pedobacter westerhofensis TaxID=425512 RepID=A0A521FSY1_9SPHI|nr:hypothetical protein [Pedobacter westerhofensis]SMO99236.1 hypothetical protein SAMN06265348_1217 [Pedobacter westerhofensis]
MSYQDELDTRAIEVSEADREGQYVDFVFPQDEDSYKKRTFLKRIITNTF